MTMALQATEGTNDQAGTWSAGDEASKGDECGH